MTSSEADLPSTPLPDYVLHNRAYWDGMADQWIAAGERSWSKDEPTWGIWGVPESELHMIPGDIAGKNAIELGCGTAYVGSWLARRGANVVAIDNSEEQLATARRLQREHGLEFPLLHGNGEDVPYPDASFDFAISEYGVSIWADPYKWVPEAARLLRPGGRLHFLRNSFLMVLCSPEDGDAPVTDRLDRPAFGMYRVEWEGEAGVEFHMLHGDWIRLLRSYGFEIEDLIDVRPHEDATTPFPYVSLEWARKWPSEEVWKARLVG